MPQRLAPRLLIVGWDAADWKLIDQLFAIGRMPVLRSVVDRGVRGDLASLDPMLSPLLWTSVATGKMADKHGILNFIEPDPGGQGLRLTSSTSRRTKALWNILTQAGLTTNVVGWYASHPAEPINGVLVSNLLHEGTPPKPGLPWPMLPGAVHPASLAEQIGELRLHPGELMGDELLPLLPQLRTMDHADPRAQMLAKLVAQCASVNNIATWLLAERPADCTMVFFETIDVVGHHFMQYHPPRMAHVGEGDFALYQHVMLGIYQLQDMMLGALLEAAGPETTLLLLSDHGFHSDHLRPKAPPRIDDAHAAMDAMWHRRHGVLAAAGPGVAKGQAVYGATLLDIAPTALTLLGVPVGADMDGRVLAESLDRAVQPEKVFSWDTLEGETGQHPPDLRQDPFEARDAMRQLAELGYIQPLAQDATAQAETLKRETAFNLAVVYMTSRRTAEAAPLFEQLVAERPHEPRFALNLAQCYYDRGRVADAQRVLRELLAHAPDDASAKVYLGSSLLREGNAAEAASLLEDAERREPDQPHVLCMLGQAYLFLSRHDDAQRVLRRAIEVDPHESRAYHALGQVDFHRQRYDDAIEHCLRAVELRHVFPEAYQTLGAALAWKNDFPRAIQALNVAVSMQPGLIEAHRYLASIYRHMGDTTNAPRHRRIVEDLTAQQKKGHDVMASYLHQAPLGPLEWAKSHGVADDEGAR